jgi:hypothetical protein
MEQVSELCAFIVTERHEIFFLGLRMLVVFLRDRLTRLYPMPIASIKLAVMNH